jgi:hypothetical protein
MNKENQCQLCGKPINLDEFDLSREIPQRMKRDHICFRCVFWLNRKFYDEELEKEKKIAVITPDYSHWITRVPGDILMVPSAFGGVYQTKLQPVNTLGVIDRNKKELFIIRYNNITHQGTIPEHLRDVFKVNGVILSPQEYKMLEDYRGNAYEFIKNMIDNAINKK